MSITAEHPPFGAADLTNCERELIHLAGSIQPTGALLVLREPDLTVTQASVNTESVFGIRHLDLLGQPLVRIDRQLAGEVAQLARTNLLMQATPIRCSIRLHDEEIQLEGNVHRIAHGTLIVELQPSTLADEPDTSSSLAVMLAAAIGRITSALTLQQMSDEVVSCVRDLTSFDRVMVYRFDVDGHGEVIAEARAAHLEPFLGQHYPASDIPQRARELYMRNRVRVLADVDYVPVPIVPQLSPTGEELDMSLCNLRSMSPLHLQYLRNMGVTATLVASLVREGRLWGLIACHHYSVKQVPSAVRAASELLSEVVSTRISALENHAQVEAEMFVRQLEHRLVAAASESGDWRDALFDNPSDQLLRPFDASGAVLFYQGEILTAGETPTRPELRAMAAWLTFESHEPVFQTSSLQKLNPEFQPLSAVATGVLAIELSRGDGEFLLWFRKEQIRTVTWAGNPGKPMQIGNDPLELSPRRSFAAWSELVRDTAKAWTPSEIAMAAAVRISLVDVILQVRALRALIADKQATSTLSVIESAGEAMILADGQGKVLIVNDALHRLVERPLMRLENLPDLVSLSGDGTVMREVLQRITLERQPWRGELRLIQGIGGEIPVAMRADPVPGLRGETVGYIFIFTDLRQQREVRAARLRLERAIAESQGSAPLGGVAAMLTQDFDRLLSAVLANASAAILQITDTTAEASTGLLIRELESATRRAAELTAQILGTVSRNQRSTGE